MLCEWPMTIFNFLVRLYSFNSIGGKTHTHTHTHTKEIVVIILIVMIIISYSFIHSFSSLACLYL